MSLDSWHRETSISKRAFIWQSFEYPWMWVPSIPQEVTASRVVMPRWRERHRVFKTHPTHHSDIYRTQMMRLRNFMLATLEVTIIYTMHLEMTLRSRWGLVDMGLHCVKTWKGHHLLNSPLMVSWYHFVITWVMVLAHSVLRPHPLERCLVLA